MGASLDDCFVHGEARGGHAHRPDRIEVGRGAPSNEPHHAFPLARANGSERPQPSAREATDDDKVIVIRPLQRAASAATTAA